MWNASLIILFTIGVLVLIGAVLIISFIQMEYEGLTLPNGPDCYQSPGICGENSWCQLDDRPRWDNTDNATRGRCVPFQKECFSCVETERDGAIEGGLYSGLPALNTNALTPQGQYIPRPSVCAPGLICTGDNIPTLPATCVKRRPMDRDGPPDRDTLTNWCMRFVRLGGATNSGPPRKKCKNHEDPVKDGCIPVGDTNTAPITKGALIEELLETTNNILDVLWPEVYRPYPGPLIPGVHDATVPACDNEIYLSGLTDYQNALGGPEYRKPIPSDDKVNPPPCIWTQYDWAYNDENPIIWSIIHTLTANLPKTISEKQKYVLRALPMFLRQYLSCDDCRSHIKEHLIDIGIPDSNDGFVWFRYFWRAHNFVNEQSAHTRCGSQDCGFSWAYPSTECAGKYMYPWYLSLSDAWQEWRIQ